MQLEEPEASCSWALTHTDTPRGTRTALGWRLNHAAWQKTCQRCLDPTSWSWAHEVSPAPLLSLSEGFSPSCGSLGLGFSMWTIGWSLLPSQTL